MKVLMMHSPATVVARGGVWTQLQKTADALRALGVEVVPGSSLDDRTLASIDLCHVVGANMATYHIAREIYRKGIPLVVSPVFYSRHSPVFLRSALIGHRLLSTFFLGVWTDYGFIAEISRWSKRVVPNAMAEARLLIDGFGISEEKITVVPNGVDERFYNAKPDLFRNRYKLDRFVLNVGNFGQGRKNTLRLIRVLASVTADAVIIGQAEDPAYYERCRREAARNPRVTILGELPNDSEVLASAYAACDVFVLPSLYETPGIAALEAGLAGAKVVVTEYGGTKEYFGEWAEYVDPNSDQSIARGIYAALNKEKSQKLREHIRKKFLWSNVGKKTLEVYESVLS